MAKYRYSVAKILANHVDAPYDPAHRKFIEDIASALYERHKDFARWPESVRFFYACYDLNFQVGSGGFAQVAYNIPELIPIAQKAFEHFGRKKAAAHCKKAISMLPAELTDRIAKGLLGTESLEEVFQHFDESAMAKLDKRLPEEFWVDDRLQDLVQNNRKDFESVDRIK